MIMPPDHPRLALAESLAQKILRRERITEPPVPVKELLEQYAIVHPFDHQTELSFCLEQDSIWQVFINSNISEQSVSYIQAHEMGHLLMNHLEFDATRLTPAQFQLLNREADHFAHNLIIPEPWLREACVEICVNDSVTACLARLFKVTPATMNGRLHNLGIHRGFDSHNWRRLYRNSLLHDADDTSHSLTKPSPTANDDYSRY